MVDLGNFESRDLTYWISSNMGVYYKAANSLNVQIVSLV